MTHADQSAVENVGRALLREFGWDPAIYRMGNQTGLAGWELVARVALNAAADEHEIDLGADFPLTDEQRERRERLAEVLENALHCARYDPIGGNVRHCVEDALRIMDSDEDRA